MRSLRSGAEKDGSLELVGSISTGSLEGDDVPFDDGRDAAEGCRCCSPLRLDLAAEDAPLLALRDEDVVVAS